jgi:hypothetical protein
MYNNNLAREIESFDFKFLLYSTRDTVKTTWTRPYDGTHFARFFRTPNIIQQQLPQSHLFGIGQDSMSADVSVLLPP